MIAENWKNNYRTGQALSKQWKQEMWNTTINITDYSRNPGKKTTKQFA
jgi:hypothetical protein